MIHGLYRFLEWLSNSKRKAGKIFKKVLTL
nr:MAG TPA: hypothetical protein [Caudoviricetes sp.]